MPLNKSCVGKQYPAITTEVTAEAIQKYARAYNDDNPAFFDASRPGGIIAPPMFGVTVIWQSVLAAMGDPEVKADLLRLVHGEQDMEFLDVVRPADRITATSKIISIETKSSGETMELELHAHNQHGTPVLKTLFGVFIRASGARSGGERGVDEQIGGEPIAAVSQTIDADQTYRYADASGDKNPIHTDEVVAKMAGLRGIIVHGLCTMAFTSKVAIDKLCAGDPTRLRRLRVRFSRPVLPGQTITTKMYADGERNGRKAFTFQTFNAQGQSVIRAGIAEVAG
ncbi:MAG: MaoC/PaaZ C-terminal domain-containing protein [Candidatus Binataceae bacterium]